MDPVVVQAGKITMAWVALFYGCLVYQGTLKVRLALAAKAAKKKFDRSTCEDMYNADRVVGNMMEWGLVFLPSLWLGMVASQGAAEMYGWLYVAMRVLYIPCAYAGGLNKLVGSTPTIFLSTAPGYFALTMLGWHAVKGMIL